MSGRGRKVAAVAIVALLLAAIPTVAVFLGSPGAKTVRLNLGPGDGPYVVGFTPAWEIESGVATHWTTYDAAVRLPLEIRGLAVARYRFSRVLPETAVVLVLRSGALADRFECRGGIVLEREVPVGGPRAPVELAFHVDSHDRRNLGLRMDWVDWVVPEGSRIFLAGFSRFRPGLVVALALIVLVAAGWSLGAAAPAVAILAVGAALAAHADPWRLHRFLTGIPEVLALFGSVGLLIGLRLHARGLLSAESLRVLVALGLSAFLLRAIPLNHPAFYYPDIHSHVRFAQGLREMGPRAFLDPVTFVREHGIWKTEYFESELVFPYSPAFHACFAWLPFGYDGLGTAMKLGAALLTVVPLLGVWWMARSLGAAPLPAAALMLLIPTYATRLSYAFFPALFGHAVDMMVVGWFASRLGRDWTPGALMKGALAVAAGQLAYVSGVMNLSVFLGAYALGEAAFGNSDDKRRRGLLILAMGLAGSALAVALYYRGFIVATLDVLPKLTSGGGDGRYPVRGFLEVAAERTGGFFGVSYTLLAVIGLSLLFLVRSGRTLLAAWLVTYALLLLGRARVPDVFLHGHETLFVTPLVCLATGTALQRIRERGRGGAFVAAAFWVWLAVDGLRRGGDAIVARFDRAA